MYLGIILHLCSKLSFVVGSYTMHFFLGRYLPEAEYGVVGTIITIMNFEYIFFTDGVRQGMAKAISMNQYEERDLIRTGLLFQTAIVLLFFGGTYLGAPLIGNMLGDASLIPYIRNLAFLLPFTGLYSLMLGILNGHKAFRAEAGTGIVYPILKLSVIPAVLFVFEDAILATQMGFLFAAVVISLFSMFRVGQIRPAFHSASSRMPKGEYARTAASYLLLFGASTFMMNLDTLILKRVSGDNEIVGYYTGVANFAKIPYYLLTAFYTVVLPVITGSYIQGRIGEAREKIADVISLVLGFILPVVAVVSAASGHILGLFYRPSYRRGENALALLIFAIAFLGMTLIFSMILSAADQKKLLAGLSIGMLAVQAVLCVILTKQYSLTGTAAATWIAAGGGMLVSGVCVVRIFGTFWQKKHTLLLAGNAAAYVSLLIFFRKVQIGNFFVLAGLCGVFYLILAGAAAWKLDLPGRIRSR